MIASLYNKYTKKMAKYESNHTASVEKAGNINDK